MKFNAILFLVVVGMISIFATSCAFAGYIWTYSSNGSTCPATGCVASHTDAGKTVSATATGWFSETANNALLQSAYSLRVWDGLAVQATSADTGVPEHATDNNDWYESVLFDFGGDNIELDQITMGWHRDSDFSLLMYTGDDTPVLTGYSYADLLSTGGWTLISNYYFCDNCGNSSNSGFDIVFDVNADDKNSSYWLVAALNPAFVNPNTNVGDDYFKIKSLTGNYIEPSRVPAPSPLFLIGLGAALFGLRSRTNAS